MFEAMRYVVKEHYDNTSRMWKMAKAHMRKQTIRTTLGIGWVIIKDLIYFTVFVGFRYLISGSALVDGMHFIVYLVTGLIPWFFMNEVINAGANAIKNNKAIINSIKFPLTILPTIEVISIFMRRLFTILVIFVVVTIFGYLLNFNLLLFLYYFAMMFLLMVLLNLITTAYVAISDDFYQAYSAITRILFFSLPIFWSFEKVKSIPLAQYLLKLNPMTYIVLGFRDAFVKGNMPDLEYTLYFFFVLILMFMAGTYTQYKLRKYYSDFM